MLSQRNKQLLEAAKKGKKQEVLSALEQGANINAVDVGGNTSLLRALNTDYYEIMQLLLARGADVTLRNKRGENVLINAIRFAMDKSIITELITHGARFDSKLFEYAWRGDLESLKAFQSLYKLSDKTGLTILHYAAALGHLPILEWLVKDLKMDATLTDQNEYTALHYAAWNGHIEAIEFLFKYKNGRTQDRSLEGQILLHCATFNNQIKVIQLLIEKYGFTGKEKNISGKTPFQSAACFGYLELMQYYVKIGAGTLDDTDSHGYTSLHHAAENGQLPVIAWLVEQDPSLLTKKNKHELTAFELTAACGHLEAVKWFMQKNPSQKAKISALFFAIQYDHPEVVEWFISTGVCDATVENKRAYNCLEWACITNSLDVLVWLLANTSLNPVATYGNKTCLHYAAMAGSLDIIKYLVNRDPSLLHICDDGHLTPIYEAAWNNHTTAVQWLVSHDSKVLSPIESASFNLLHVCSANGNNELVTWLIDKGNICDLYQITKITNKNPLQFAIEKNHTETVRLLLTAGAAIKADLSGIDLSPFDTKDCIFIGAHADGEPIQLDNAINTAEQFLALSNEQLDTFNLRALRKAVNYLCTFHTGDTELLKLQDLLNQHYNNELKSAIRNGTPMNWAEIHQQALAQLTHQPDNHEVIQTKRIAQSLSSLKYHCLSLFAASDKKAFPDYQEKLNQDLIMEAEALTPFF